MARPGRIRTIKPEFFTDATMSSLSEGCRLLFLGLLTYADDEGKFIYDVKAIQLSLSCFRVSDVSRRIGSLIAKRRLVVGSHTRSGIAWLSIANWNHQRINRMTIPKIKSSEIQWDTGDGSLNPGEGSLSAHRKYPENSASYQDRDQDRDLSPKPSHEKDPPEPGSAREIPASYRKFESQFANLRDHAEAMQNFLSVHPVLRLTWDSRKKLVEGKTVFPDRDEFFSYLETLSASLRSGAKENIAAYANTIWQRDVVARLSDSRLPSFEVKK